MNLLAQEATPVETTPVAQPGGGATGAPSGAPMGGCGSDPSFFLLIGLIWVVIYFVMIRPQNKAEKARKAKLEAIRKGDRVRTRGGIIADVVRVKDGEVVLRLDADTRVEITVAKNYVDEVLGGDAGSDTPEGKG